MLERLWTESRGEPYRVLFPLGLIFGCLGMGVWIPFYFWPEAFPYPGQGHAAVQIQGFLLCFIFGFLCTMMPKVLGVKPLGALQFAFFPVGLSVLVALAFLGLPRAVQAVHLLLLINFAAFIAMRWRHRAGSPPPPFIFIALAMASDLAGTALRIAALSGVVGSSSLRLSSLLQFQAFPLLLILGVGSFLLPKLFQNAVVDPRSLGAAAGGMPRILPAMGLLFLATYPIEAFGPAVGGGTWSVRAASLIRAGVWAWFLFGRIRLTKVSYPQPAYLEGARLSLYAILAGLFLPALWPAWMLAWEHVVFLGGLMWLTLSIASRVVAAHGGRLDLLVKNKKPTMAYGAVILAAVAVRVATDLVITTRWMHLAIAGTLGVVVLGLWAWKWIALFFRFPART